MRTTTGTIYIFTFKEGALSAVAHDLRIRIETFDVRLDGDQVHAELQLPSLKVDGPVKDGIVQASGYDARQRAQIETAMHADVLRTARYPVSTFDGRVVPRAAGFDVSGQLALAGRTAPLGFSVTNDAGAYRARIPLRPSRWGIAPYKALLGTIRVQDEVIVAVELVATG